MHCHRICTRRAPLKTRSHNLKQFKYSIFSVGNLKNGYSFCFNVSCTKCSVLITFICVRVNVHLNAIYEIVSASKNAQSFGCVANV